ncbi:MAG: hypothetical protein HY561_02695 [Gemmatimonadetes bacterium]|nr:hypothetical protein [Gemmatimonadota bacterium]
MPPAQFRRTVVMAIGVAIGALWIAMATAALWSSVRGFSSGRSDWGLGWGLVGILLLAAGGAAIVGVWWHEYRLSRDH